MKLKATLATKERPDTRAGLRRLQNNTAPLGRLQELVMMNNGREYRPRMTQYRKLILTT